MVLRTNEERGSTAVNSGKTSVEDKPFHQVVAKNLQVIIYRAPAFLDNRLERGPKLRKRFPIRVLLEVPLHRLAIDVQARPLLRPMWARIHNVIILVRDLVTRPFVGDLLHKRRPLIIRSDQGRENLD